METVRLNGKDVVVVGWRDAVALPPLDLSKVDWANIPMRRRRPSTLHARTAYRRPVHEPLTATSCLCGDAFADADAYVKHLGVWMPSYRRVRFRYAGMEGEQVARPMRGHTMRFRPSPRAGWGSVRCSCRWESESRRIRRPGRAARSHLRAVVSQRLSFHKVPLAVGA